MNTFRINQDLTWNLGEKTPKNSLAMLTQMVGNPELLHKALYEGLDPGTMCEETTWGLIHQACYSDNDAAIDLLFKYGLDPSTVTVGSWHFKDVGKGTYVIRRYDPKENQRYLLCVAMHEKRSLEDSIPTVVPTPPRRRL